MKISVPRGEVKRESPPQGTWAMPRGSTNKQINQKDPGEEELVRGAGAGQGARQEMLRNFLCPELEDSPGE